MTYTKINARLFALCFPEQLLLCKNFFNNTSNVFEPKALS